MRVNGCDAFSNTVGKQYQQVPQVKADCFDVQGPHAKYIEGPSYLICLFLKTLIRNGNDSVPILRVACGTFSHN